MPRKPEHLKLIAALATQRAPGKPLDIYEKANNRKPNASERAKVKKDTAAALNELVVSGEVYSVYRDDGTTEVAYGLTKLGRKADTEENPKKGGQK